MQRLRVFHAQCLRVMAGVSRVQTFREHISTHELSQQLGLASIETYTYRRQLRWLGHILRREPTDPLRLVIFEPGTLLLPRLTGTGRKRVVGRPRIDWAQTLIEIFCDFVRCSRDDLLSRVIDKPSYHFTVERLCSHMVQTIS